MPLTKLKEFLDEREVKYVTMSHSRAYTAQEIAQAAHIPGQELAKTVMVKLDGKMAMAVVPASYRVNLEALAQATQSRKAELASEQEFEKLFPGCETGAMPPFGNLFDIPVYAAESLDEDEEIAFNAGTHTEVMKLDLRDYKRLVEPTMLRFSEHL